MTVIKVKIDKVTLIKVVLWLM